MGDYFGNQTFDNKRFITYNDYSRKQFGNGDIIVSNSSNYFSINVEDVDQLGSLSESLFGFKDDSGKYRIEINGYADGDSIEGTIRISLLYGDMTTPFSEEIEFTCDKKSSIGD